MWILAVVDRTPKICVGTSRCLRFLRASLRDDHLKHLGQIGASFQASGQVHNNMFIQIFLLSNHVRQ